MARRAGIASSSAAPHSAGSLEEWLRYFGVELQTERGRKLFSIWPPDVFAIAAAYLRRTGGYVGLIGRLQGGRPGRRRATTGPDPVKAGRDWRRAIDKGIQHGQKEPIPTAIHAWWSEFIAQKRRPLDASARDDEVQAAAWNLCIAADEACEAIGTRAAREDLFLALAQQVLVENNLRSYCLKIPPEKLSVLGKRHTPQRGCTIRSLTHHLALYAPSEILARWHGPFAPAKDDQDVFNLLLLPWPMSISAADFRLVPRAGEGYSHENLHRFFRYRAGGREAPQVLAQKIGRALKRARRHADRIHGIVFPELALNEAQYEAAERVAIRNRAMLVAGVGAEARGRGLPRNMCAIQPFGLSDNPGPGASRMARLMRLVQSKHHQWCLDRAQIMQYELGGRLPASHECWEDVDIVDRRVNFATLSSWLTMCVLICEDLARQDPVADVMRAVGPNLVIALLMDGPQLRHRWAARYASVLAEDPGCSVLSLTSAGMSARSRPREENAPDKRRVIALWRDAFDGDREIALEPGHDAVVLSLVCRTRREYSLDGRADDKSFYPVFAGAYSFASQRRAAP